MTEKFDYLRRRRTSCLYCGRAPTRWEHVVPEAVGGKLGTYLVCDQHYQIEADHRFAERFAPMTQLMEVRRQDGRVGAAFVLERHDGSGKLKLYEDGSAQVPTEVVRDEDGNFVRVTGEIGHVPKLRKQIAGDDPNFQGPPTIQLVPRPPMLVDDYGFGPHTWPTVLKIALHFVGGFDSGAEPPSGLVAALQPNIFREPDTPDFVSITNAREPYFTAGLENAHEVVCFAGDDHVTVGVALYGVFRAIVRLDGMKCSRTLRYVQGLHGEPPRLAEAPTVSLNFVSADADDAAQWMAETRERVEQLVDLRINKFYDRKVRDALPTAYGMFVAHALDLRNPVEGIAYHLQAELELSIPDREDLEIVLREALSKPNLMDKFLKDMLVIGRAPKK